MRLRPPLLWGWSHRWSESFSGVVGAVGIGMAAGTAPLVAQSLASKNLSVPVHAPVPPVLASAAAPLVLRGVTVIDIRTGRRLPDRTVMIAGTRIQALGRVDQVRVPRGAQVVDARGKYLIPGLWDMHLHVRQDVDIVFPLTIATGVTGILNRWSAVPLAVQKQWQREVVAGSRAGPRMFTPGPEIDGDTTAAVRQAQASSERGEVVYVTTSAEARRVVDSLHAAGADWIATYALEAPLFWVAAAEARRLGLPLGGHVPKGGNCVDPVPSLDGRILADSGVRFLDHGPCLPFEQAKRDVCGLTDSAHLDVVQCAAVGQWYRRKGLWVVEASGASWDPWRLRNYDLRRRYNSGDSAQRNQRRQQLDDAPFITPPLTTADWRRLFSDSWWPDFPYWAGGKFRHLPMVVGSHSGPGGDMGEDTGLPGFAIHNVLVWLVAKFGVTPLQALQASTWNPAQALRVADSLGTVEAGKVADLVLLDADPLADIAHIQRIRAVVANGRYYDRVALDSLLAGAERAGRGR